MLKSPFKNYQDYNNFGFLNVLHLYPKILEYDISEFQVLKLEIKVFVQKEV